MNTQKTIKLFRFPTPKSLGMSSCYIHNKRNDEKDFDDYLLYLKDNYSVRYFFAFFLQEWFNLNIVRKVKDIYWWFQHNFNPRHRYHMLDLRQPKSNLNYRYFEIVEDLIKNKNLKCSSCNIPAPHLELDKYICDVCKVLSDIS